MVKSPEPNVAVPVFPVPPFVELTFPVVLTLGPEVVVVTFTLTAQEAPHLLLRRSGSDSHQ
jgi:hypothetical protein